MSKPTSIPNPVVPFIDAVELLAKRLAAHNVSSTISRDARIALDTGRWPHTPPEIN